MPQSHRSTAEQDRELDNLLRMSSVPPGTPLGLNGSTGSFQPHVYVLGCLDRRVTIYAQQMRALNLVWALHTRGELEPDGIKGKRIGIVGAGIAGLTASIAALRLGASVHVFDRNSIVIRDQNSCMMRWLHPRVFDWPFDGWNEPGTGLPVLPWMADYAGNVAANLRAAWEREFHSRGGDFHPSVSKVEFAAPPSKGTQHLLRWAPPQGQPRTLPFDAVILAVGFGKEQSIEGAPHVRYWDDARVPEDARHILVIGCGDGGLIDVLRARLQHFAQGNLLQSLLSFEGHNVLEREVRNLEYQLAHNRVSREDLKHRYNALTFVDRLKNKLFAELHPDREVTLVSPDADHLNPAASPLHRLLVHLLVSEPERFRVRFETAKVHKILTEEGKSRVECALGGLQNPELEKLKFDHVVVRTGPASALKENFPRVYEAVEQHYPRVQQTALPEQLFPEEAFSEESPARSREPRASTIEVVPFRQVPWAKYLEEARTGVIYSSTGNWFLERLGDSHDALLRFLSSPHSRLDLYVSDPSGMNFESGLFDSMEERRSKIDKVRRLIALLPTGRERISLHFVDMRIRYSLHVFDDQVSFVPQASNDIFRDENNLDLPALCFDRTDGGSGQKLWDSFLSRETASIHSAALDTHKFHDNRTFLGRYVPDAARGVAELTEQIRSATELLHSTITSPETYSKGQPRSDFNDVLIERVKQGRLQVRALVARGDATRYDRVRRLLTECSHDKCQVRVLPETNPPSPQLINFAVIDNKRVVQIVHREHSGYFLVFDDPDVANVFREHFNRLYEFGKPLEPGNIRRLNDLLKPQPPRQWTGFKLINFK